MDPLTPEQTNQLKTWASERDSLLEKISILKTEKDVLTKKNKELAESNTEIQTSIVKANVRMEELDKKESLYMEIVSIEIPKLEVEKTTLETEVMSLQKEVSYLDLKKEGLQRDLEFMIKNQKDVFERTGILEKIVEHVTDVSETNIKTLDNAISSLTEKVKEVIELSTKDIEAQNRILGEIPKLFVELQRKVLARDELRKVK